jgi:hypothetical protein
VKAALHEGGGMMSEINVLSIVGCIQVLDVSNNEYRVTYSRGEMWSCAKHVDRASAHLIPVSRLARVQPP